MGNGILAPVPFIADDSGGAAQVAGTARDEDRGTGPRARPVVAVVLAGGVGRRMGAAMPKQLLRVAGRTILEHSVAAFESAPEIDEIVVLMASGHLAEARDIVARGGFRKVTAVVEGGASRTESTWRALAAVGERDCDVLLHDAVRPLVTPEIIRACVAALETCEALEVAIPSSDTIVRVAAGPDGEIVRDVPDRATLRRTQTPQGFRLSVIREAYRRAFADPGFAERQATDDCGVVLRYLPDVPIHVVPGVEHNLKITHPLDMAIAERLFRLAGPALPPPAPDAFAGRTVAVFGEALDVAAELAATLREHGAAVHRFHRADGVRVDDARAVADALATAAKESGRVDHVVYAAFIPDAERLGDAAPETVAEALGAGTLGPANVARATLPFLRESRGHLLFCVPASGGHGSLHAPVRAALAALARTLAREWAEHGVRVNCVDPAGPAEPDPGRLDDAAGTSPISPAAVAETALAVLAANLTGEVIGSRTP
jgi:2-C-methyl-D-erythritol 4-phosphate cytidylyltransferase